MKTISSVLAVLLLGLSWLPGAALATSAPQTVETYVEDSVITTKVKTRLLAEADLRSNDIKVETFKGVVQLSGFVNDLATQRKAVALAGRVAGVKSVKNDMRLK